MKFDRVLTVNDYRDGPRRGVAELDGVPHIYEAEFDDNGEGYGDTYFLSPIEPALLALVLEQRAACADPQAASGELAPAERVRREARARAIDDGLRTDPEHCRYFRARFGERRSGWWVQWLPLGLG